MTATREFSVQRIIGTPLFVHSTAPEEVEPAMTGDTRHDRNQCPGNDSSHVRGAD